jgi:ribosomal protein S18 acetylase RimI-like enzyme
MLDQPLIRRAHTSDGPWLSVLHRSCRTLPVLKAWARRVPEYVDEVRGLVAIVDHELIGHLAYHAGRARFELVSLAVTAAWRRSGIATALVEGLVDAHPSATLLVATADERNLGWQLFLQSLAFRCTAIEPGRGLAKGDGLYRFVRHVRTLGESLRSREESCLGIG